MNENIIEMMKETVYPRHPFKYLVLDKENPFFRVYYSNHFDTENFFIDIMIVFDLHNHTYTEDGKEWKEISTDHF